MKAHSWNENEIKDAIAEYFKMLEAQQNRLSVNKLEVYRNLSKAHPSRSPRAFERKFTNISAILYEEKLPFVDGLLPSNNYQRLLRLLVLDHLDRNRTPSYIPKEILKEKVLSLYRKGTLKVQGGGSGRYGLAVEKYLGVPQNSSKSADFMGIELKTSTGKTLQTLFSRIPTEFLDCENKRDLVLKHGYYDIKRERQALYTSFSSKGDSLGFSLKTDRDDVFVIKNNKKILSYEAETLEEALLSKHSETAFIKIDTFKQEDEECFKLEKMVYGRWPSIIKFMRLIDQGRVYLDFTLSIKNDKVRDHGFCWRIDPEAFDDLFLETEVIELEKSTDG